jgi:GH3 auxin-responsive promoter
MAFRGRAAWRTLACAAEDPLKAQRAVVRRLLEANKDTRFGREHGFADIDGDYVRFVERVPVQDYERLRPYIEEQRRTGGAALTAESPIFYAQTSGTTGKPKYIPVTPSTLDIQRREQMLFSYLQYRACPRAFAGKALGVMGAAVEGRLDTGHVVGSVSGHLYRELPLAIRSRFVVPPEVSDIPDYDLKYLLIARLALAERDITYLGSPNPTTFLRLMAVVNDERERLRQSFETGTLDRLSDLSPHVRAIVARRIRPDRARAEELTGTVPLTYARLWPRICLVTTWTGGSCGIALDRLRALLPVGTAVMELGYQSTECRGTMALQTEAPGGLPPLTHHFFEFVERAAWDRGSPEYLTIDRLESGRTYYVLITTASGLYRYFMNDLVEVTGRFRATPLLRFVQKGRGVTSLTGEKLYEAQAIEAVRDVTVRLGITPGFFLLVADEGTSTYRLFVEFDECRPVELDRLGAALDNRLGELNLEYQSKRHSGRLGPLAVVPVRPGTGEAYKAACVRAGQREGQYKPQILQYSKDLALPLDGHALR